MIVQRQKLAGQSDYSWLVKIMMIMIIFNCGSLETDLVMQIRPTYKSWNSKECLMLSLRLVQCSAVVKGSALDVGY